MTAIPASQELKSLFASQKTCGNTRGIKVVISENEVCELDKTFEKGVSFERDFDSLATVCEKSPCYVLFRKDNNDWMIIIHIPDSAKVAEKLVYAATTVPLKANLEYDFEEFHASCSVELSWKEYQQRNSKDVDIRSEREKNIDDLNKMEEQARKEFSELAIEKTLEVPPKPTHFKSQPIGSSNEPTESQITNTQRSLPQKPTSPTITKPTTSSTANVSSPSSFNAQKQFSSHTSNRSSVSSLTAAFESGNTEPIDSSSYSGYSSSSHSLADDPLIGISKPSNAAGVGGFHAVTLPVDSEAKSAISQIRNGQNWIELKIENERIVKVDMCTIQGGIESAKSKINMNEPRFYLFSSGYGSTIFVYCCPDNSPPKLRMVYATAKKNVEEVCRECGIQIEKKLEIRERDDLTSNRVNTAAQPNVGYNSSYANQTSNVSRKVTTVDAPHPVYSMMNDKTGNMGGFKKRIVIPPRGAY